MRQIGISPDILNVLAPNAITPFNSKEIEQYLFRFGACPAKDGTVLTLAAFGFIVFDGQVLVMEKPSGGVLGVGRKCTVPEEYKAQSPLNSLAESLYREIDAIAPNAGYRIRPVGFIHADRREYDRGSLGVLYRVDLEGPLPVGQSGDCAIRMMSLSTVGLPAVKQRFWGWSQLIAEMLACGLCETAQPLRQPSDFVLLRIAGHEYAIAESVVTGYHPYRGLTTQQSIPPYVIGETVVHNELIPVVDLAAGPKDTVIGQSLTVILEIKNARFALIVDLVVEILRGNRSRSVVTMPAGTKTLVASSLLSGMLDLGYKKVPIIDSDAFFFEVMTGVPKIRAEAAKEMLAVGSFKRGGAWGIRK